MKCAACHEVCGAELCDFCRSYLKFFRTHNTRKKKSKEEAKKRLIAFLEKVRTDYVSSFLA